MVKIQLELNNEDNKKLTILKGIYGYRSKSSVIRMLIFEKEVVLGGK